MIDKKQKEEVTIDPTKGVVGGSDSKELDYIKIVKQFGCKLLNEETIERYEKLTGQKAHHWIRRGLYFAHRDFGAILDLVENKRPFFLYTGRGPSGLMHLGHLVPFMLTKHLQDVFKCPLVIQITDDEKYLLKDNLTIDQVKEYAIDNIKNIIACGFDPERTFIFCDYDYIGKMYPIVTKIAKCLTLNQIKGCFGFNDSDNIGKWGFPPIQMAPSFNQSFPTLLPDIDSFEDPKKIKEREEREAKAKLQEEQSKKKKKKKKKKQKKKQRMRGMQCLIPCAIDQDPYFRLTRDIAHRLNYRKPSTFYSKFFPGLGGPGTKMSTSLPNSCIFLGDGKKAIKKKIGKAFSGGAIDREEQEKNGADLSVDVAFQYLTFFLEDDEELKKIEELYGNKSEKRIDGKKMLSGVVKKRLIEILQKYMKEFQERREKVTDEVIQQFMSVRPLKFGDGVLEQYK